MLPISVPRGANIISSASVARLMNFIVTSGDWNTGTRVCAAAARNSLSGFSPRLKTMHGIL